MFKVAEGIYTNVPAARLRGVVLPPKGWNTWEEYENSFYPYWNEVEGKWEY